MNILDKIKSRLKSGNYKILINTRKYEYYSKRIALRSLKSNSSENSYCSAIAKSIIDNYTLYFHGTECNTFHASANNEKNNEVFQTDWDRDLEEYAKLFPKRKIELDEFKEFISYE